jgi:hypothetical protein
MDTVIAGASRIIDVTITDNDNAGALYDPPALVFKVRRPSGTVTTLTYPVDAALVRDSIGKFHVDVLFADVGNHGWSWHTGGTGPQIADGWIKCRAPASG